MMRTGLAFTLNQRVDDLLASAPDVFGIALVPVLVGFLAADVGGVGFNGLAFAA